MKHFACFTRDRGEYERNMTGEGEQSDLFIDGSVYIRWVIDKKKEERICNYDD